MKGGLALAGRFGWRGGSAGEAGPLAGRFGWRGGSAGEAGPLAGRFGGGGGGGVGWSGAVGSGVSQGGRPAG